MADVAWTRKYRASNLNEYLGTEVKTKTISRLKDEQNFPQTVLISGPKGTGKTSIARLIAKTMHCENRQNGCACGVCDNCKAIDEELINAEFGAGAFGVTEVNVGTDGGKADVEEMIEQMKMQPQYPLKYNIFILDECHMYTPAAQNALLKVLEEPPSHLVIMMATTDPERLLGTVKDRCQFRLRVKPPTVEEIVQRLLYIASCEKLTTSEKALTLLVRLCKKNPRDCIMTLENVAKNFDHNVTVDTVLKEVGAVSTEVYAKFIKCANSANNIGDTLEFVTSLEESGITYKAFLEGLSDFVINCMQIKYGIGIEEASPDLVDATKKLFNSYHMEEIDVLLQILEYANKLVSADESTGRLTILTTAMRISKVKALSIGLQHLEADTIKETKKGSELSAERHKQESESATVKASIVDDALIASMIGNSTKEVVPGENISLIEDDVITDKSAELSDEDLLAKFCGE